MGSWRKAYGALKDSTKVGLAKVNSDFKVSGNGETGRQTHGLEEMMHFLFFFFYPPLSEILIDAT
jgi:hypothetical protein